MASYWAVGASVLAYSVDAVSAGVVTSCAALVSSGAAESADSVDAAAPDAAFPPQAQRDNTITAASADAKILFFMRVLPPDFCTFCARNAME